MTQLQFHLADPGLTLLHRAGLAGLWMTLQQLDQEIPVDRRPGSLSWELAPRQIQLSWQGEDFRVIDWLLKESFQLKDGIIALRGMNNQHLRKDSQVIIHQGILGTFLQHGKSRTILDERTLSLMLDEDKPPIILRYKALESYSHQNFAKDLCDNKGQWLKKPIKIAGWLNPGAVVRHQAFTADTGFEELPEMAFILLYAPVACHYYLLRSRLRDQRAQYALVIPEVTDLAEYADYRQQIRINFRDFHASGLGDAGLKFLTLQEISEDARRMRVPRCQVLTLGTVTWSSQQKTRTDLYTVEASYRTCRNYRICREQMSEKIMVKNKAEEGSFIVTSFARELIAENLARNRDWYAGFGDWINSNERFQQLTYERGGLYQMVVQAEMDPRERWFVEACHEAIRFTYGRLAERTKDRGELANFDRENVRIRTGLTRCKNAETFREFITDFWSRAGRLPTLQEHWDELMAFVMDPKQWRKARDLALVALASYKSKEKEDIPISSPELEDLDEEMDFS